MTGAGADHSLGRRRGATRPFGPAATAVAAGGPTGRRCGAVLARARAGKFDEEDSGHARPGRRGQAVGDGAKSRSPGAEHARWQPDFLNRWRQNLQSSGSGWGPGEQQLATRVCRSVDAGQCGRTVERERRPVTAQAKQGEFTSSSRFFVEPCFCPPAEGMGCCTHTHIVLFVNLVG